jgi:hypothetical protein
MQALVQIDLQLLKDQTHYSNVFVRCYESFHEFIQNVNQTTLKNFLEQLECLTAIVKLWNNKYNGKEAQIKKGFDKEKIKREIEINLKKFEDKEIKYHLIRFLELVSQKNANSLGSENIYKNIQKNEMNEDEIRNIGYEIQKGNVEVEKYVKNQQENDFPDFNINNDYYNNKVYYYN